MKSKQKLRVFPQIDGILQPPEAMKAFRLRGSIAAAGHIFMHRGSATYTIRRDGNAFWLLCTRRQRTVYSWLLDLNLETWEIFKYLGIRRCETASRVGLEDCRGTELKVIKTEIERRSEQVKSESKQTSNSAMERFLSASAARRDTTGWRAEPDAVAGQRMGHSTGMK